LYANSFLCTMSLFVPFVYLPAFAHDHGASEVASATLVGIIGGASVVGRLGLGTLADRMGLIWLYQLCYLVQALSFVVWLTGSSYPMLEVFALTLGASYGGFLALSPSLPAHHLRVARRGTVTGML